MIKLLAAHVVADLAPEKRRWTLAEEEVIREVTLRPDGSFAIELQLLHGEVLRVHIEDEDGNRQWEYIRIDPESGPVMSVLPVDDEGQPA